MASRETMVADAQDSVSDIVSLADELLDCANEVGNVDPDQPRQEVLDQIDENIGAMLDVFVRLERETKARFFDELANAQK